MLSVKQLREEQDILGVMESVGGDKRAPIKILGISKRSLNSKVKQYPLLNKYYVEPVYEHSARSWIRDPEADDGKVDIAEREILRVRDKFWFNQLSDGERAEVMVRIYNQYSLPSSTQQTQ